MITYIPKSKSIYNLVVSEQVYTNKKNLTIYFENNLKYSIGNSILMATSCD
jgi:hypothetical protein